MEPTHPLYACFVPILHFCAEPILYNTNCFTSPPGCPCPAPVPNHYYNIYAIHAASVRGPLLYGCHDQYHTLSPALYNYQSKHAPAVYNYPMSQHAPDYDAVPKKNLKKSKPDDIINRTCYKVCGNRVSRNKGDRNETFNVGINCFTFQDLSPSSVRKKKHGKLIGNKYGTHHRCDSKAQKRSRHR
ncbi:hypothetical protein Pyn_26588 [Prunus yedoensis var. nudiflora]|uniref:Uncharacterized protein n=1 Tax=Prunus yedoensis var. nudiflora TaxID=2094558 RepID=A0A314V0F3_PRUYE|nr:hypothetical protein Pyn_26588 [Prunus yedoensis var. nudiflora]